MQADNKKFEEALINEILSSKSEAEAKLLTKVYILYLSTLISDDDIKTESDTIVFKMQRR